MTDLDPVELCHWQQRLTRLLQEREGDDGAHDLAHARRVWQTAQQIMAGVGEPVNGLVVLAACYLHDLVVRRKDHSDRARASVLAAEQAQRCLSDLGFPGTLLAAVAHAIAAHSYSARIQPQTLEARIVQDADRMEALGAIGLARVFYTAGVLKQKLFDPDDPLALNRPLDERRFALDHFQCKLLKIAATMQTEPGRQLAQSRSHYLMTYVEQLCRELAGDFSTPVPLS